MQICNVQHTSCGAEMAYMSVIVVSRYIPSDHCELSFQDDAIYSNCKTQNIAKNKKNLGFVIYCIVIISHCILLLFDSSSDTVLKQSDFVANVSSPYTYCI